MSEPEFIYFPLIPGTKEPACKWRDVKPGQYQPVGDHGVGLPPDVLVLDFDPRNYPLNELGERRNVLQEFIDLYGGIRTRCVYTPRGGAHIYLRKDPEIKYKQKQPNWPGVDFKQNGGYVCGVGTSTVESKDSAAGTYELAGPAAIADAPKAFLADLLVADFYSEVQAAGESLSMEPDFILRCETHPPAIEGQHGDDTTFALACIGRRDWGLPEDVVFQHMRDIYNPRCQPQWTDQELWEKVKSASKRPVGTKTPESKFTPDMLPPAPQPAPAKVLEISQFQDDQIRQGISVPHFSRNIKTGKADDTLFNVAHLLKHDHAWQGRFRYNQFASCLEFKERPYWRKDQLNAGLAIDKRDIAHIQLWMSASQQLETSETKIWAALEAVAEPVHPVKAFIESTQWDGVPRLDRILVDTAGVADTPLNRDIGRCLIGGAIQRIYEPGCKVDTIPIFEGPEGTGKSLWIATLGGEWASTGQLVRGDKDTYQNLRGRWIVELPEINSTFSRADANWLKGIITTATDVYRSSYGRTAQAVPRESVFIGTINPDASYEYLSEGENRRYLPVRTGKINVELLKELRAQYFAEAFHRYQAGEKFYITDPLRLSEARKQAANRVQSDPWVDILRPWLSNLTGPIEPRAIYDALGLSGAHVNSYHRKRLYATLKTLAWEHRPTLGTGGAWYRKELTWEDLV